MELLENARSIQSGGSTDTPQIMTLKWSPPPAKFEGLGNYAGILGTDAAVDYLTKLDLDAIHEHEVNNTKMTSILKDVDGLSIIGPQDAKQRGGICSIILENIDAHDVAILLDEAAGVMVRSGMHCVHSWFNAKGIERGSLRASAYLYNTEDEVKLFAETLVEAVEFLGDFMDDLPQIPDGHLEDDFDFLRTLTIICSVALFGALGFYTWMIYTGEISLVGPSALVLEKDEDFDSLIEYKPVSDLTEGVDVCIVDSGIDMTHRTKRMQIQEPGPTCIWA